MSFLQSPFRNLRALSIVPLSIASSISLIAAISATAPSHAQSASAADTAPAADTRRDGTSNRRQVAFDAPGPFTYDALGATPSIRLPGQAAARTTQLAPEPKDMRAANQGAKQKTSEQ